MLVYFLRYLSVVVVFWVGLVNVSVAQSSRAINGKIVDAQKKALPFATIKLLQPEIITYSDANGFFTIRVPISALQISLAFSYVGKQTINRDIDSTGFGKMQLITLQDLSLSLDDVQVSGVRKGATSNSSFMFDRESIEQLQAFSVADILNKLPGKAASAPNLQTPQTITLRTSVTGEYAMSNSLGTAIIMDGIRMSNDANMQSLNVSRFGMAGSAISGYQLSTLDVPFTGLDLRDIPADNIENIEVVTGVASAQYGELTDGAIIINRKAGKTKYQGNIRINGGSTDFSLSKGWSLGKKLGALNISLGYLNSNQDPRDKVKSYSRLTTGLMWTTGIAKWFKNTLSVDYNTKFDNVRIDPDDDALHRTYSKNRGLTVSNRSSVILDKGFVKTIGLNLSYSRGYQDSYDQWLLNGLPKGIAAKDTTGVYEGYFIPGAYLAEERVVGKPISMSARLSFSSLAKTAGLSHSLSYGTEYGYSANKGEGIISNPDRPRWASYNGQGERPYNFAEERIAQVNYGFYLQDNITTSFLGRNLYANIGIRADVQNGWPSYQPRLNIRYKLSRKWELNLAYGISSKAPTLAHRYPSPAWLDIPLLNLYTGNVGQNLYLVYTQKVVTDNSSLKPSNSTQFEVGTRYNGSFITASIYGYMKKNRNGFNSYNSFVPLILPDYGYTYTPGQDISYYPTGDSTIYASPAMRIINNGLRSNNSGIELTLQTKKIRAIQTSVMFNSSLSYSSSYSANNKILAADQSQIDLGKAAWYGVYKPLQYGNYNLTSSISTDTHIPKLGFVVTLSSDIIWLTGQRVKQETLEPIGYINSQLQFVAIDKFDASNPDYGYLKLDVNSISESRFPFPTANLHVRLSKEIKKLVRLSVGIYNIINSTSYYINSSNTTVSYRRPMSITAGFSFKL